MADQWGEPYSEQIPGSPIPEQPEGKATGDNGAGEVVKQHEYGEQGWSSPEETMAPSFGEGGAGLPWSPYQQEPEDTDRDDEERAEDDLPDFTEPDGDTLDANGGYEESLESAPESVAGAAPETPQVRQQINNPTNTEINGRKTVYNGQLIDSTEISTDELGQRTGDLFEPPGGLDDAKRILLHGRLIVLAAEDGGRDTSALALIASCSGATPRRIGPRTGPNVGPNELAFHEGTAWLLDLTDPEGIDWDLLLEHLAGLRDHLRKQESFLVAVARSTDLTKSQIRLNSIVRVVDRPDPYEVLERHLKDAFGQSELKEPSKTPGGWREHFENRQSLHCETPAEAVRLCEAICDAERYWESLSVPDRQVLKKDFKDSERLPRTEDDGPYVELIALDRFQTWEAELDVWNETYESDPRIKTFQVAIAVLPSGDPVQIRNAANNLLERIDKNEAKRRGLGGMGTRLLAKHSLAKLKDDRIEFPRPGFDEAVVRYFWDDWPEFRPQFLAWLMGLALDKDIEKPDREKLKQRIGDFAIHHAQQRGAFDFLKDVITQWADEKQGTLEDAVRLLERAATTSGISRKVRELMLQWVGQEDRARKRVVGEVCASVTFVPRHPQLVLTRLSHLMDDQAKKEYDAIPKETLLRGCRLLITESGQTNAVLAWIAKHIESDDEGLRKRAARMFLSVAQISADGSSVPALVEQAGDADGVRPAMVAVWAVALRELKDTEIQETFDIWMDSCAATELEDQVITVVKDAIAISSSEAGEAYFVVGRLSALWAARSSLPAERVRELEQRLRSEIREAKKSAEDRVLDSATKVGDE